MLNAQYLIRDTFYALRNGKVKSRLQLLLFVVLRLSFFVLRSSFAVRHSLFVIRCSLCVCAKCPIPYNTTVQYNGNFFIHIQLARSYALITMHWSHSNCQLINRWNMSASGFRSQTEVSISCAYRKTLESVYMHILYIWYVWVRHCASFRQRQPTNHQHVPARTSTYR